MEELKELIQIVAHLPGMALWAIAAFWAYKVICIGSIYGVIRLGIVKAHSWLITPKTELVQIKGIIKDIVINDGVYHELVDQIRRIAGRTGGTGIFVHQSDVEWLRLAIDEKKARDMEKKK